MRIGMRLVIGCSLILGVTLCGGQSASLTNTAPAGSTPCEKMASLSLPNSSVTMAKVIEAGAFPAPPDPYGGASAAALYKQLPAFCRVIVHAHPSPDSDIPIEVWMPLAGWNGKLQGVGNGGFAGQYDYSSMAAALARGYAATATDTGHSASGIDASWALGHPEKVADFGYRGIHEMTLAAKAVGQQFYGTGAKRAYFAACSDGGREALMEAQRFPEDFDGILAGAPANYWTALLTTAGADTQALTASPGSYIPQAKIPAIAKAVLTACDELDGVKDGILNDPRECRWDPATIQCKVGEDTNACLTAAQVTALKALYAGPHDAEGRQIFPGYLPGAEEGGNGWGTWITGPAPGQSAMAMFERGFFSDMVYGDAKWDIKTFDLASGLKEAQEKTAAMLDAVNPDLSAFRARGGKLILYHGWNDPAISALNTVNYYGNVVAKTGETETGEFVRLYMLPGVQHCGGGPGPDMIGQTMAWPAADAEHNARVALEEWVEKGTAPGPLVATKMSGQAPGTVVMTRPVCPYPQSAKYKGSGDPNKAESFSCAAPAK